MIEGKLQGLLYVKVCAAVQLWNSSPSSHATTHPYFQVITTSKDTLEYLL